MPPVIEVHALNQVNFAFAYNRIPFVRGIAVSGLGLDHPSVLRVRLESTAGLLTQPFEVELEPDADGAQVISPVPVPLDLAAMGRLDEDIRAALVIEVEGAQGLVSQQQDVHVRSSNTWSTITQTDGDVESAHPLSSESLASFVRPNDPAVTAFMAGVRARLERETGSSATQGYQAGSDRVDQIARAIWDEARTLNISYTNPPASWSAGQKVRTPHDVLEGRAGTCLDTTVVLAAAFEHVGLHPVLVLVHQHAFVAYWRDERLALQSVEDLTGAVNAVDLGVLRVLETTEVCGGASSAEFDADVHRRTRDTYLTGDLGQLEAVVDVRAARRQNGIIPLPVTYVDASGQVSIVEYSPAEHSGHQVDQTRPASASEAIPAGPPVPGRVQSWKNSLLDLSLRNKLINFTQRSSIQLAVPTGSLGHVEDLLNAGQSLTLQPGDQIPATQQAQGHRFGADLPGDILREVLDTKHVFTDIRTGENLDLYLRRMRALAHKARTIEEETGANNLYLALGSLHWNVDGRPLKSPLILLPVTLAPGSRRGLYRLQLDEAGASTPNFCLVEKLRQVDGLSVPGLEKPVEDEHGIDLKATFDAVRVAITDKDLPYRVDESADIAILQFAKFRLWKDLDEDWQGLMSSPLVRHLVDDPTGHFEDPRASAELGDLDDLDATCPIPADASQLEAIAAAVAGRTFVLEGPPGTGKSQTITNLLARAIAGGKRVLFVAEKRAALDVVSSRLASIGMGPFSLDLHDKSSKPSAVRQQIKEALDLSMNVDTQGLAAEQETAASARRALARYADRLHEKNDAGFSLYSARTQVLASGDDLPALPITVGELERLTPQTIDQLRNVLRTIEDAAEHANPQSQHPWGFIRRQVADQQAVVLAVGSLDAAVAALPAGGTLRSLLDLVCTQADLDLFASLIDGPAIGQVELDQVRTRSWQERANAYVTSLDRVSSQPPAVLRQVSAASLDLPLADLQAAVEQAASSGFFGRKKRVAAALAPLEPHLAQPVKPKEAPALVHELVEARRAADQVRPETSGVAGLRETPGWNPYVPGSIGHVKAQIAWLQAHAQRWSPSEDADSFGAGVRGFIAADQALTDDERAAVRSVAAAAREAWSRCHVSEDDLLQWTDGEPLLPIWQSGAPTRSQGERALTRWQAFVAQAGALRDLGLAAAFDALLEGRIEPTRAASSLDKGLALASVEERLLESGLDRFDGPVHDKVVQRFASSMSSLRVHLRESVAADVLQARPFRSGSERGQVGALKRELARQRGGMKVRELLATYGDLITQVMPCVLVSPDSVARFFPVGSIDFDLVVFDEASQIRVCDAVGAMGRASAAVVVGDSKQMPPTSFGDTSEVPEGAESLLVEPDQESILTEVGQAGVEARSLTWHYRSQDESLISFSNDSYYEKRLSSFPSPDAGLDQRGLPRAGVSLVRTDGTFVRAAGKDRGTNRVEAEAIVEEIRSRFAASPAEIPSIGVVTFNAPQRGLIDGMLRDLNDARIADALEMKNGEGLFVKNLETVQGDERDVILFSTAFSKNDRGYLPLNFGPLNNRGGERRLNVAITRARLQVIVFTSFDPSDLRVDATGAQGIKDLGAYLHMAQARTAGQSVSTRPPVTDRHRNQVADALTRAGLVVQRDLGLSDFKIDIALAAPDRPDEPVVAVLLDNEEWASRRTVGDRDGLPVAVLQGLMGWKRVERVWLPEWLADPQNVASAMTAAVEAATAPGPPEPLDEQVTLELGRVLDDDAPLRGADRPGATLVDRPAPQQHEIEGAEDFEPFRPEYFGSRSILDELPARHAVRQVQEAIEEVVEAEGPVSLDRLARLVAAGFQLTRLSPARILSITKCIPSSMRDRHDFAWPAGIDRESWTSFRTATADSPRPVVDVHPQEMANAIVAMCRDAHGMSEDEILRGALGAFGWKRRTEALTAPVRAGLDHALQSGRLSLRGEVYVAS